MKFTFLFLLTLATSVQAQDPIPALEHFSDASTWAARHQPTPGVPTGTRFHSLQVGRLTSLSDADVITLRGTHLYRLANVASQDRVELLATGVTSFAVLPGLGTGGLDQLVSTNASGLSRWSVSNGALTAGIQPLSGWSHATHLCVGALASGNRTLYGLDAGGTLLRRANASTITLKLTALPSLTLNGMSGTVQEIRPLYFDSGTVEDLAVLTSANLHVRSTGAFGTDLWTRPALGNDLIAVSRGVGAERDTLLLSFSVGAANYLGYKFGGSPDFLLDLPGPCTSLASFDISHQVGQPLRNDVVLCLAGGRDAYVLQRLAYSPIGYFALPEPAGTAPYRCDLSRAFNLSEDPDTESFAFPTAVGGGDVDGDLDEDLVFGIHDHDEVRVFQNSREQRWMYAPVPSYNENNGIDWLTDPAIPRLRLFCQSTAGFASPDKIEIVARYQVRLSAGEYDAQAPAVYFDTVSLEHNGSDGMVEMNLHNANPNHVWQFQIRYTRSTGTPSKGPTCTIVYVKPESPAVDWDLVPDVKDYHAGDVYEAATIGGGSTLGGRGPGQPTP